MYVLKTIGEIRPKQKIEKHKVKIQTHLKETLLYLQIQ